MKKKLLIFAFAFCLILPCAFLMTACELGGGSGGEGSNSSVDAFDTALAINGEGVSALGKSVTITSAGTYYFKYVVEDEIPLAHNWKVMFNLAGGTTEEGTITKIEVYNSTKTLVKTIDTPTSNTNHGNWIIAVKNSDEELRNVGTYYLKVDFAKTGAFLAKFNSSTFN